MIAGNPIECNRGFPEAIISLRQYLTETLKISFEPHCVSQVDLVFVDAYCIAVDVFDGYLGFHSDSTSDCIVAIVLIRCPYRRT